MLLTQPQETLNEIVAHLRDEERALQSLSLVDKRLTEECRRYLFWSINIDSERKLQRWHDAIPPGKDGLSRYVRLLGIDLSLVRWRSLWPNLQDDLAYLCSFPEVEHLSIRKLEFDWFSSQDLRRCFSHFSTIRSISIQPSGYLQDIPDFLAPFPLLETTAITSPNFTPVWPSVDLHFTNLVWWGPRPQTHQDGQRRASFPVCSFVPHMAHDALSTVGDGSYHCDGFSVPTAAP